MRAIVLGTIAGILLYALLSAYSDLHAVLDQLERFTLWTLWVALGLVLTSYFIRIVRWQLLLRHVGHPVSARVGALAFLAGFALSITPGKVGEVVKAYYLREGAHVPYRDSLAAVVAERFLDGGSIVLFLAASGAAGYGTNPWIGVALFALVAAFLYALRHPEVIPWFLGKVERVGFARHIVPHLRLHHERLRLLLGGRVLATVGILGILAWAIEPLALAVLARGFHVSLPLTTCYFLFSAATLAGVLTLLPGGLGVTEGSLVALLTLQGVPLSVATPLVLTFRLCTLWFGVAVGSVSILVLRALGPLGRAQPTPQTP